MESERARAEAWRSATSASALDLCVGVLGSLVFKTSPVMPVWPFLQFAAVGAVLLAVLLSWRKAPRWLCLVCLQLDFLSALLTSLGGADAQTHGQPGIGHALEAFQSVKAGIIVIGVLSPSMTVGVVWIAVFAAAPAVQVATWADAARAQHSPTEAWMVPVYGVIGVALLLYRRRSAALERALATEHAERLAAERLARVSLALRDLANTPLQTLTAAASLLRHELKEPEVVLDALDRSIAKLETIQRALAPFEEQVAWPADAESFDAVAQIEELAKGARKP